VRDKLIEQKSTLPDTVKDREGSHGGGRMKGAGSRPDRVILCLNSGSSSVKLALFRLGGEETLLAQGAAERIGQQNGRLWIGGPAEEILVDQTNTFPDHQAAVRAMLAAIQQLRLPKPAAVGHRVVHGGPGYAAPALVNTQLLDTLRKLIPFAPLHLPGALYGMESVAAQFPGIIQVACFDTAFHRRMPEINQRFPLPRSLYDEEIRRYGFHGLSYEYILDVLGPAAQPRTIIAHLGNGASMAAIIHGRPLDTTMGLTPTGGFMMGTRCGDLDPGVLLYLLNEKGYGPARIDALVNHESGLLGVSGISSDMKMLLEISTREPHAREAVEMFCHSLRKHVGALAAVLGGVDMLVFTGGIGEHAASVRWNVCQGLAHLGIHIDEERNTRHADQISTPDSSCQVCVIPTNEDLMIARHTYQVISCQHTENLRDLHGRPAP
jgi:acetate kinase